jgi:hypothetical protein
MHAAAEFFTRFEEDAVEAGRAIARRLRVEHSIHRTDGTIGEKELVWERLVPSRGLRARVGNPLKEGYCRRCGIAKQMHAY